MGFTRARVVWLSGAQPREKPEGHDVLKVGKADEEVTINVVESAQKLLRSRLITVYIPGARDALRTEVMVPAVYMGAPRGMGLEGLHHSCTTETVGLLNVAVKLTGEAPLIQLTEAEAGLTEVVHCG
jgi:hypothetical protein